MDKKIRFDLLASYYIDSKCRHAFVLALAMMMGCLASPAQNRSRISGVVVGPDLMPVKRAFVTATQQRSATVASPVKVTAAPTSADGQFVVSNLPSGDYTVCVQAPGTDYLDPCRWAARIGIKVAAQDVTGLQIKLQRGKTLDIQVEDPANLLNTHERKTPGAHLLIGVWTTNGLFVPASPISKGSNGRLHRVVVPGDTALKWSASSKFFAIADSKGVPITASTAAIPIQIPPGSSGSRINIRITGLQTKP